MKRAWIGPLRAHRVGETLIAELQSRLPSEGARDWVLRDGTLEELAIAREILQGAGLEEIATGRVTDGTYWVRWERSYTRDDILAAEFLRPVLPHPLVGNISYGDLNAHRDGEVYRKQPVDHARLRLPSAAQWATNGIGEWFVRPKLGAALRGAGLSGFALGLPVAGRPKWSLVSSDFQLPPVSPRMTIRDTNRRQVPPGTSGTCYLSDDPDLPDDYEVIYDRAALDAVPAFDIAMMFEQFGVEAWQRHPVVSQRFRATLEDNGVESRQLAGDRCGSSRRFADINLC